MTGSGAGDLITLKRKGLESGDFDLARPVGKEKVGKSKDFHRTCSS
jgi:hypothetical protein